MIQFQTPPKKNTVGKRASEQEKEQLCTKHLKEEALAMEPGRLGNELQIAFVFFYFCFFVIGAVVPFTLAVEPGMLGNDLQISKPTALIAYRKPHNLETFVNYPTLMCFSC